MSRQAQPRRPKITAQRTSPAPSSATNLAAASEFFSHSLYYFAKYIIGFKDLVEPLHEHACAFLTAETVGALRARPDITRHIVGWQDHWALRPDTTPIRWRLCLMPRDHFKSSIGSVALPLYRQVKNQNISILQSSSKIDNSAHFAARHRRLWENNVPLNEFFPGIRPVDTNKCKWSDSEYVITRTKDSVEATVTTTGVGGGIASRHYDLHIFDDLINETMVDSPTELQAVKNWFEYAEQALGHPETSEMIGLATLWPCDPDISVHIMDHWPEFMVYRRSAIEDGRPIFPERYTLERLLDKQRRDPKKFACNMMNQPRGAGYTEFDETWLRFFESEETEKGTVLHRDDGKDVYLGQLNVYPFVDPAMAEKVGEDCQNAVAMTGIDCEENIYILEDWASYCTPTDVIYKIIDMDEQYNPEAWYIEGVAYQKCLKHFLEYVCREKDRDIKVEMVKRDPTKSKTARIRGLEPIAKGGRLWVRRGLMNFKEQFACFPMAGKLNDVIDAVANGPQVWQPPLSEEDRTALDEELDEAMASSMAGRNPLTGY